MIPTMHVGFGPLGVNGGAGDVCVCDDGHVMSIGKYPKRKHPPSPPACAQSTTYACILTGSTKETPSSIIEEGA